MKNTFIIALLWCFVSSTAQTKETNANQTPKDTLKEKEIIIDYCIFCVFLADTLDIYNEAEI